MRRGQFGSTLANIIFWVILIVLVIILLRKFVVGSLDWIPGLGDLVGKG